MESSIAEEPINSLCRDGGNAHSEAVVKASQVNTAFHDGFLKFGERAFYADRYSVEKFPRGTLKSNLHERGCQGENECL